jgi:hypothetical protein
LLPLSILATSYAESIKSEIALQNSQILSEK